MKKYFLFRLLLLLPVMAAGQDITVEAEYPSVVRSGQQFAITWTINSGGGEFEAPPFTGFYKLMGPQTQYSSSTQFINGRITHQTINSYTYYLQAAEEGVYVLPPASYTLKNKTWQSDSIRIEVVAGGRTSQGTVRQAAEPEVTEERIDAGSENISVALLLNRNEVFIGEGILATVKIYTRTDLAGISEIKYPSFTGFMKADLETPALTSLKQENINGTIYGTGVIQQFLLYPQVTGEILIDPVQITVLVRQKSGTSDPFFGDFFSSYQTVQKALISKALKVNIKPLPGVRPDDFSGVVGRLDISTSVSRDTVNVNDAVNFKVTISGNGNLKLAQAPSLKLSPDIETYDPKITDNLKTGTSGTSGQRTFEYLLIPRSYGEFTIPAFSYSYFDPSAGRYQLLTAREHKFYARKVSDQTQQGITVYGGVSKQDVKYVGKDIRYIRSDPGKPVRSSGMLVTMSSFYSAYALTLILFLTILFIRREHIRRNADVKAVRNRKAGKVAAGRLRDAALCMKRGEKDRFFEEILKALWGYLSDKLNIPVSDLTRTSAAAALQERGINYEAISGLTDILDKCEYARYAPSAADAEVSAIYDEATRFIRSIENSISHK